MAEDSIIPIGIDIITASKEGNPEIVQRLIEAGLDVNDRDTGGYKALHWACQHGRVDIARLLLEAGADPCARNQGQWTPLDYLRQKPVTNPAREEILDLFRQYAPEQVVEAYCSPGPGA